MTIEERIDNMENELKVIRYSFTKYNNMSKCKKELITNFIAYSDLLEEREKSLENVQSYLNIFSDDEYERLMAIIDFNKEYVINTFGYSLKNCDCDF